MCVFFFTPCLKRLVVGSPCLVHWGAAICSFSGIKGRLAPTRDLTHSQSHHNPGAAGSWCCWPPEGDHTQYKGFHSDVFMQHVGMLQGFTCSTKDRIMCQSQSERKLLVMNMYLRMSNVSTLIITNHHWLAENSLLQFLLDLKSHCTFYIYFIQFNM